MPLEPGLRSLTLSTAHACRPCLQVTCNQGHRDIKASILDGQYPDERADIVNRYFAKQIDQLLEYIKEGQAFGELCAYCYVIEYQKRGNVPAALRCAHRAAASRTRWSRARAARR